MKTFCGIDIGLKGGVAVIDESSNVVTLLPLKIVKNQQGKDEINVCHLYEILTTPPLDCDFGPGFTVIEALKSFGNEGRSSLWSFGTSNGKVRAVLEILGTSFSAVDPKIWKNEVLKGTKKDKAAAIGYCLQRWPTIDLKQGSEQYRDGLADALCIAEYARRLSYSPSSLNPVNVLDRKK